MKRGVIIDLADNFAIVLTADGHFVKTRDVKSHYQIGEEITFQADESVKASSPIKRGLLGLQQVRIGFVTAIAIILIFFSLYPVFNANKVYAYMTIDINPSFELAINGNMEVVKLEPLNEDGRKLLASFPDWNNQGFQSVVNSIINQSRSKGYLKKGKEVLITTVIERKNDKNFEKNLLSHVQTMETSYTAEPMTIKTIQSNVETRNKAKEEGVSTGTYIRNHHAEKSNPPASPEKESKKEQHPAPEPSQAPEPEEQNKTNPGKETGCKPACDEKKEKPEDKKQKPDPKVLKEMEKKGKQPPTVPPERDKAPSARQDKETEHPKQMDEPSFGRSEDEDKYEETNNPDDLHSEDSDSMDGEDGKKKDSKVKKEKDSKVKIEKESKVKKDKNQQGSNANRQMKKAAEDMETDSKHKRLDGDEEDEKQEDQ
ncbi:anti-sigma factor domain-containing protein [Bacillus sp. FJAT-42376]|uniref:anti-sigma factor domain-containing protein n=1 Tax=Bacillus sp. FJAT-42376 TaxID=2014076 RepID=UPI000F4E0E67|nr:anti-sigma factor domain-containing protein [Bacillus sp. FJAT-42376]AZB42515.1 anti-sigma factor domain-containing protein [Bacillus sp. FJAT-42376]